MPMIGWVAIAAIAGVGGMLLLKGPGETVINQDYLPWNVGTPLDYHYMPDLHSDSSITPDNITDHCICNPLLGPGNCDCAPPANV